MSDLPVAGTPAAVEPGLRRTSLGLIFVIVFIDLLGFAIVLPLLPRYAKHLHAAPATIGMLMASFSAMQFLFAPAWGRLSDRVGRRPALLAGLAGSVIFYALFGYATIRGSLAWMFVARIGAGIAGATIPTAQAYIADATDVGGRNRGMAMIGAAFGIGFTFGPILGSISLPQGADFFHSELNPLPGFLAAALSLIALSTAVFKLPESLPPGASPARRAWFRPEVLRETLRVPSVVGLLGLFFLSTFAFAQFEATLSLLTDRVYHLGDAENFWVFTYLGVTLSLLQGGLVRALAKRVSEKALIVMGVGLMGLGMLLVAGAAELESFAALLAVIPVLVCGFSFLTPSIQALISRRSDPRRQGEVLGLGQSTGSMARILGPIAGNVLFGFGTKLPYVMGAGMLLPALALAVTAARRGKDWGEGGAGN